MQFLQVEECAAGLHPRLCGGDWGIRCLFSSLFLELASNAIFCRSKNAQLGYTPDFVEAIGPHLSEIKRQGVRVVTNGGGMNPKGTVSFRQCFFKNIFFGDFFSYFIQHCFICRPSDSTVPTDAGIEPRTVATGALAVRRSNH